MFRILPIALAMCFNVIIPNMSLAFSSIMYYQIARILLTPTVAIFSYYFESHSLSGKAILAIIPTCTGVGIASYYQFTPISLAANISSTTAIAAIAFAAAGVIVSSLYTVSIRVYKNKLQLTSMQLLYRQCSVSSLSLPALVYLLDEWPDWSSIRFKFLVLILAVCLHHSFNARYMY